MHSSEGRPRRRRWIAHLDMDAFYASVELLRYPELRGAAVVIGGGRRHQPIEQRDGTRRFAVLRDYAGRGVVTTATYAARAHGVGSGMGLMKAAQLAPDAVLLPTDFDRYRHYSRRFKAAVAEVAPVIEDRGIDEIYIDLTDVPGAQEAVAHDPAGGVRAVAQTLRNNVRRATGLTCSIGVTPNKLLSKIASDLDKPDGLTLLTEADVPARIWPLAVRRINGVGPKAGAKLAELGIETIGDLARADPALLVERFGRSVGTWLHQAAHGRDDRPVVTSSEPVSMSRETTFERNLHAVHDRALLSGIFTELCEQVAADLARKGYAGKTIGIKLRFDDFKTVTRDHTLAAPTADARVVRRVAGECLKRVDLSRRLRLLGVRVGTLARAEAAAATATRGTAAAPATSEPSLPLFEPEEASRPSG
ncbi:MAG TPA: DNA polymerase IV [Burkholderiaceae bacterium]